MLTLTLTLGANPNPSPNPNQVQRNLAAAPVLSGNDWHLLLPRRRWPVLDALRPGALPCDARCAGGSAALLPYFRAYNEYCMALALALYLAPSPNAIPNPNQVLPADDGPRPSPIPSP